MLCKNLMTDIASFAASENTTHSVSELTRVMLCSLFNCQGTITPKTRYKAINVYTCCLAMNNGQLLHPSRYSLESWGIHLFELLHYKSNYIVEWSPALTSFSQPTHIFSTYLSYLMCVSASNYNQFYRSFVYHITSIICIICLLSLLQHIFHNLPICDNSAKLTWPTFSSTFKIDVIMNEINLAVFVKLTGFSSLMHTGHC